MSCRRAISWSRCAAIVLKGAGTARRSGTQLVALAVFAIVVLGLASLRLKREWS